MRIVNVVLFSIFWCMCTLLRAQELKLITTLLELIPELEEQHNIKFNYLESSVQKIINLPLASDLNKTLELLEKQTHLKFELVDKELVVIRNFKSSDSITVCGYVKTDKFPRSGIKIKTETSDEYVITDEKGYFKLKKIPFTSNVIFQDENMLFKKVSAIQLFEPTCSIINIESLNEQLEEVLITNYLTKGVTKQSQKINIKSASSSILPGIIEPDVLRSLEHIPSIQSPFETPSRIYVRGSTPDQNLVLWNDIKTYSQSHFFGLISAFNPYVIDETNFYAKGVQAKYGDRLAGVIDIKSGNKIHNQFSGGSGVNLISADAFVKVPIVKDRISLQASLRRSYTDLVKTPSYTSMAERVFQNSLVNTLDEEANSQFYFIDYSLGVQAAPTSKDSLQFNFFYSKNDLTLEGDTDINNLKDNFFTENEGYSLQWQHQYSDKISQSTSINLSNYTLDYLFENSESNTDEFINETKKNFVNDYGAKTFFNFNFNSLSKLQLGYQYSNNSIRYAIENNINDDFTITLDEQKSSLETHSVFSEYVLDFNHKVLLQIGVRLNKYSIDEALFVEPRLYTEATLFPNFKINSSFTLTSQAITQIQESITSSLTLGNLLWRITDDNEFEVLTSQQYSLGSIYKNKSWFIEGDGFYKSTQNITTLTAGFLNPIDSEFNEGKSKTFGAELFIKKKFKRYATWISYTYTNQESKFESLNNGEYFISNLNIEHTFKWQHFYELNNFQFSLGWIWNSGKAITAATSIKEEGTPVQVIFEDLNAGNLPIYNKLDFSVLYNFKLDPITNTRYQLGLAIQNVYNRKSILNREFRTTPGIDNELITIDYNSLGFTPNVSLRIFW